MESIFIFYNIGNIRIFISNYFSNFFTTYNKSLAVSSFWRILHSFRISQIAFDIGCFEYLLLHQVIYGSK